MTNAELWAEHAYLRSVRTCDCRECAQYTVEEAIFMCMFYIWMEEYGPGWESAAVEMDP